MTQARREFLKNLACGSAVLPLWSAQPDPISIDAGRQLFVDDYLIHSTTLVRTSHKPKVHDGPVLKPETEVEMNQGVMPAAGPFSDGVWYDPKDKLYKMWYIAGYDDGTAYATSHDGIHWDRPQLDVVPGTNRVFAPSKYFMRNGTTIWLCLLYTSPSPRD